LTLHVTDERLRVGDGEDRSNAVDVVAAPRMPGPCPLLQVFDAP
jgi:hypothetical protein